MPPPTRGRWWVGVGEVAFYSPPTPRRWIRDWKPDLIPPTPSSPPTLCRWIKDWKPDMIPSPHPHLPPDRQPSTACPVRWRSLSNGVNFPFPSIVLPPGGRGDSRDRRRGWFGRYLEPVPGHPGWIVLLHGCRVSPGRRG